MVKFSLANLNLEELLAYIGKLKIDIEFNDRRLTECKNYVYGLKHNKFGNMSEEEYRIRNIEQFFKDKANRTNLLKYSRKQKQLKKKLEELELYLIDKGLIRINLDPEEIENIDNEILHYHNDEINDELTDDE